ncbi:MAG TPA: DUF2066 domain-containing protein [Gammaproteobacteria bacterium]|nr:DUF2066 domain-containing protein [Gammaproteobacteria bacterium]
MTAGVRVTLPRIVPLLIALALLPAPALASVVQNLYSASVPVTSQAESARAKALQDALSEVIVKVTGSATAPGDPQVAAIVSQPEHYLQAYRYKRHVPGPDEPMFGPGAQSTLDLWAQFDPQALDRALRAADQPIWGSERPATLVWIAYEQSDGQRDIVSSEAAGKVEHSVEQAAAARGVPVIFPLMDIEDRSHVGFADVWGGFTDPVVQASQRYQPDAILIGRVGAGNLAGGTQWTLKIGAQTMHWEGISGKPADVAAAAIQHVADIYAGKFAIRAGVGAQQIPALDIVVSDITDLTGYARVLKYLRSLNAVNNVEPMQVAGDQVTFKVSAQGTVADLKQTIGLGALLGNVEQAQTPALPTADTHTGPVTLHYRYQP